MKTQAALGVLFLSFFVSSTSSVHAARAPLLRYRSFAGATNAYNLQYEIRGESGTDVMKLPTDGCRCSECKYMKMNTLTKLRDCMKNLAPRVELPKHILDRARLPIERMLEISAKA